MSYQCKVWLDNYAGQYTPGSVIQGKIACNFDSETTLRSIKLKIKGIEHTEWLGEESYHDSTENKQVTRQVLFNGDNEVLAHKIILFGGDSSTTLPAGQHFYPFSYTLPFNLPGTYFCPHGSITYKVIGIVDRPMRQDYEDVVEFNVAAPIDLNAMGPDITQPKSYSDEKTVCCFCCASGPITLDANLSKQAVVPGETITITARLTNNSNVNIEGVTFEMKQKFTFKTLQPSEDTKVEEFPLLNVAKEGLGAHGEHTYDFKVELPSTMVVPNFDQCSLFKCEYFYLLTAKLPSYHSNLTIDMKPIVGNVPIGQSAPNPSAPPPQNPAGGHAYPNLPPQGGFPPQGGYGPPPGNGNGSPTGPYGPPPNGGYAPPMGGYGPPPGAPGGFGPPAAGGYGPPPAGGYGPPPPGGGFVAPPGGYPQNNQPIMSGPPPPAGGYPGGYPPMGGYPQNPQYSPYGPPPGGNTGYNKEQEANRNPQEPPPPSYDSVSHQ